MTKLLLKKQERKNSLFMSYIKSSPKLIKKRLSIRAKKGDVAFEIYP
jgi:hypothetical protein